MARLIDADALNTGIDKCVGIDGLGLEPVMAIRDIKSLLSIMPTIAAIPVEWLKKVRKDDRLTIDDVETIDLILIWWQKEQEARQCLC